MTVSGREPPTPRCLARGAFDIDETGAFPDGCDFRYVCAEAYSRGTLEVEKLRGRQKLGFEAIAVSDALVAPEQPCRAAATGDPADSWGLSESVAPHGDLSAALSGAAGLLAGLVAAMEARE